MAYNNYYPVGYQPYTYNYLNNTPYGSFSQANEAIQQGQPTINQAVQNTPQNGLIWVSGEAGARGYPIAPNTTVQLWDSESETIYLKSSDQNGIPTIKILDYKVRETPTKTSIAKQSEIDMSIYVTRDELAEMLEKIKKETQPTAVNP